MWNKKRIRVYSKLFLKRFKSNPNYSLLTVFSITTLSLFSVLIFEKIENSNNKFSNFTKWQSFQKQTRIPSSQINHLSCQYQIPQVDLIKSEISKLESRYQTQTPIQGKFKGAELTSFSSIGAQFILENKNSIKIEKDLKNCTDVPCILNEVYKDDELHGLITYYWYLKTGYTLSVSKSLPMESQIDGKGKLFNTQELSKFYYLAKSLPEKFLHTPLMTSIHKVEAHKIKDQFNNNICSKTLSNGQVLLSEDCLNLDQNDFSLLIAKNIANYIDLHEGSKLGKSRYSLTDEWIRKSLWVKESYFDTRRKQYFSQWKSNLPKTQFLNNESQQTPKDQFANLLAYYRFAPDEFKNSTPIDLAGEIQSKFFHSKSFDPSGLLREFLQKSMNSWAFQEPQIWDECLEKFLDIDKEPIPQREIASGNIHPLYTCVENKIDPFIEFIKNNISNQSFEGCQFFSGNSKYSHVNEKYDTALNKYLNEMILQRKIELRRHGKEVFQGQKFKSELASNLDATKIYISCYTKSETEKCYNQELNLKINYYLNKFSFSDYYRGVLKEDIQNLYTFSKVKQETNLVAKKFLAPYKIKLVKAVEEIWTSCKKVSPSHSQTPQKGLKFDGNFHYVDANFLTCLDNNLTESLSKIADIKAIQKSQDNHYEFSLNPKEKKFAHNLLAGQLKQIVSDYIDQDVHLEKIKLTSSFKPIKEQAIKDFTGNQKFLDGIYSPREAQNKCLEEVVSYYPKKYFYHTQTKIEKNIGRSICSTYINVPDIKEKISERFQEKWNLLKNQTAALLKEDYIDRVENCRDDYPVKDRSRTSMRNSRYLQTCIRDSFQDSINYALVEWIESKDYKNFYSKENELHSYLQSKNKEYISKALNNQKI